MDILLPAKQIDLFAVIIHIRGDTVQHIAIRIGLHSGKCLLPGSVRLGYPRSGVGLGRLILSLTGGKGDGTHQQSKKSGEPFDSDFHSAFILSI